MSARQSVPAVARKSYTAVGSFGLAFFKYTYTMEPSTLVESASLTAYGYGDFPAGRVLFENGKKIVPASAPFPPILTVSPVTGTQPLTSYMVGVFDPQSGLSGFIDPNSVNFAINSTDLPVYMNANTGRGPSTAIPNSGNPIITNGNILSLIRPPFDSVPLPQYVGIAVAGSDYLSGLPGNPDNNQLYNYPFALITSEGGMNLGYLGILTGEGFSGEGDNNWAGMYNNGDVYFTGNLYTKNTAGTVTLGTGATVTVLNVSIGDAEPIVFLTYKGDATTDRGILSYKFVANGGGAANDLVISSTDGDDRSQVNWFLVNVGVNGNVVP